MFRFFPVQVHLMCGLWSALICVDCLSFYVYRIHALMRGSLRENK